jgi:hypothetical protein
MSLLSVARMMMPSMNGHSPPMPQVRIVTTSCQTPILVSPM